MRINSIKPLSIWIEGKVIEANKLGVVISNDNMTTEAIFEYKLFNNETPLTVGFININGEDYQNWGSTGDTNQEAIVWVANKINIELV